MSDDSNWALSQHFDPARQDPMKDHYGKPAFSLASPEAPRYVGRVIVELWEGDGTDDSRSISVSLDPADRSQTEALVRRVSAALASSVHR